jgi:IrrE N-terminal-like domain
MPKEGGSIAQTILLQNVRLIDDLAVRTRGGKSARTQGHQPATLIVSPDLDIAMRSFDPTQEDEANWLSWCLLLPRAALLYAKRQGHSAAQIAARYGVTESLIHIPPAKP